MTVQFMGKPRIHVDGVSFGHLSGYDEEGCYWKEFTVDHFAQEINGECSACGVELEEGWQCLDGGDEYCYQCVEVVRDGGV